MRSSVVGTGRAHGKVILLGEHTVVYGAPAIAFPLPDVAVRGTARVRGATVGELSGTAGAEDTEDSGVGFSVGGQANAMSLDSGPRVAAAQAVRRWGLPDEVVEIRLHCAIPPARGLGSSAACAGAAVRALADLYGVVADSESVYELVQYGEQFAHGRASGVDARTALAARPLWFQGGAAEPVTIGLNAVLVLADTGNPCSTQHAVAVVREKLRQHPHAQRLLSRAAAITTAAAEDLAVGRPRALGEKLDDFQSLLHELGVSTPALDALIVAAHDAGALGAKLTGGGLGGCVLALADRPGDAAALSKTLLEAGAAGTWLVPIGGELS